MDESSFSDYKQSMEKSMNLPNEAFFGENGMVQGEVEVACKVIIQQSVISVNPKCTHIDN